MTTEPQYRRLEAGEIIQEGDEFDNCYNPWHDEPKWVPVNPNSIGKPASDPQYVSHCQYRRKISSEQGERTDERRYK